MARLGSAMNVYNTCLRILRQRGYRLWAEEMSDHDMQWWAEKDGFELIADNPIELLGLAGIYEFKQPVEPKSYWWTVEGDDIYRELMDAAKPYQAEECEDEDEG